MHLDSAPSQLPLNRGQRSIFALLLALSMIALCICPFMGAVHIDPYTLFHSEGVTQTIFWKLRLPRTLTAFLAGAFLAVAGLAFQTLFRNPLASPFTLGVSAGAAFGVALCLQIGTNFLLSTLPLAGMTLASMLGALLTIACVRIISRTRPDLDYTGLLLVGVIVNFIFSSMVLFLQYISDFTQVFQLSRWLMGGLDLVGSTHLLPLIILAAPAFIFLLNRSTELDLLALGEDLARSRGLDTEQLSSQLFIAVSLMVAAVVAVCGPIAFVGIIVPYILRTLIPAEHRLLLPGCFLSGGIFLLLSDTAARTLLQPVELPVGILCAALGGPFFLVLLLRRGDRILKLAV